MRKEVRQELIGLSRHGRLRLEGKYFQHGTTTVLEHSVKVAVVSLWLADRLVAGRSAWIAGRPAVAHSRGAAP